jgi:integrase/recombinase XerD
MSLAAAEFARCLPRFERWQLDVSNHRPSGVKAALTDLGLMVSFLAERHEDQVDGPALLEFVTWLRRDRANSPAAANRKISSVKTYMRFLRFLQIEGAESVPARELKCVHSPWRGPPQTLRSEEVRRLLDGIDRASAHGCRDFTVCNLLYRLGLRVGEVHRLVTGSVDLEGLTLTVDGKGGRQRVLPLVGDLPDLLRQYLAVRERFYRSRGQSALFLSQKGARLAVRTIEENFAALVARTGPFSIPKVTPHTLRHAFASHAVDGGNCDLVVLKAVMGHAILASTEIYLHPSHETLRRAVNDHPANEILAGLSGVEILSLQQNRRL